MFLPKVTPLEIKYYPCRLWGLEQVSEGGNTEGVVCPSELRRLPFSPTETICGSTAVQQQPVGPSS